jgi:hypothetical protein
MIIASIVCNDCGAHWTKHVTGGWIGLRIAARHAGWSVDIHDITDSGRDLCPECAAKMAGAAQVNGEEPPP